MKRPMDDFLCPYCFGHINHELVHFRSAKVETDPTGILPDEYDPYDEGDVRRFISRYEGPDKEKRVQRLFEWQRFAPKEDPVYQKFWREHGGETTEVDSLLKYSDVRSYNRPIIDPSSLQDRSYLKDQDGGGDVFVRDADGMVVRVELADGKRCTSRVCPHCHNPLPSGYGKHPIKFVSVIGITGSGKTVFLSQLLKDMQDYAAKVGLAADVRSAASRRFYEQDNVIAVDVPLPDPTPRDSFQQPLFYDLTRLINGRQRTDTFVLYDVAGEVFEDYQLIQEYAPFIEHSDGLIMLVDPEELRQAGEIVAGQQSMTRPAEVLNQVHTIVFHGKSDEKCKIPFAICITKTDTTLVQKMLSRELQDCLLDDVHEIVDELGYEKTVFNAREYAPIAEQLNEFIRRTERAFSLNLRTNYTTYAFFGFTALGCEVDDGVPVGPILPKRIEEPLLWLFYQLGFIGREGKYPLPNPDPIKCPNPACGSIDTVELTGDDRYYTTGWGIFKKKYEVNRLCRACGHRWMHYESQ